MLQTNPLILMVTASATHFEELQKALEQVDSHCQMRRVNNVSMALARVAGGGVQAIVVDCSGLTNKEVPAMPAGLGDLKAPGLKILLWSRYLLDGKSQAAHTALLGEAVTWVTPATTGAEWTRLLAPHRRTTEITLPRRNRTVVIAVLGAKGGVGTSTVAMNIAAGLAERGSVILAELRSTFGSLHGHFNPGRLVRGQAFLKEEAAVSSVLWPVPSVARMRILFGPQSAAECRDITPRRVTDVLGQLAGEADFVVVDLPVSFCETNRTILGASDYLALVVEPTASCVRLGKLALEYIQSCEKGPASIAAVIVKTRSEGVPMAILDIEEELGIPILRMIPPASELCILSELLHVPMLQADSESLASESLMALARSFHAGAAVRPMPAAVGR